MSVEFNSKKELVRYVEENITNEMKLEILKDAKWKIIDEVNIYTCIAIKNAFFQVCDIVSLNFNHKDSTFISNMLFPELTLENAKLLCEKRKMKLPYDNPKEHGNAFWDYSCKKPRLAMLNWLISTYSKK